MDICSENCAFYFLPRALFTITLTALEWSKNIKNNTLRKFQNLYKDQKNTIYLIPITLICDCEFYLISYKNNQNFIHP